MTDSRRILECYMKISLVLAELLHEDGQTDRDDEADIRFWQFCERT
jgi:hypothetical protein